MTRFMIAAIAIVMLSPMNRPSLALAGHGAGKEGKGWEKHGKGHGSEGHGKGKVHGDEIEAEGGIEPSLGGPFFQRRHETVIHSWFTPEGRRGLPPGLQKHLDRTGHLPPGLEKQLVRNGHLPPGLERDLEPVPPYLATRFGPLPPNTRLFMYGRDAILLNYHTRSIVDIMRGGY
jgi:hypothetical protein